VATLRPFRALRPRPADAARIAAVPYDVVSTEEARALAEGNPLSFLRVSRAEIELSPDTDPHSPAVYERAAENFARLRRSSFVLEDTPSIYLYRLQRGDRQQTGLAACFALDDYDRDVIKKHERTRHDKEDDRTRHMLALRAQTGPVFLVYRARAAITHLVEHATAEAPLVDFESPDTVRHTVWRVDDPTGDALIAATAQIPTLYIADGHHRAASAARARIELEKQPVEREAPDTDPEFKSFLAVAFPDTEVQILPYNRVVRDLAGRSAAGFLDEVRQRFEVAPGGPIPRSRGEIAMYLQGRWHGLLARGRASDVIGSLDVSVLQDELLAPVLGIHDVRSDPRIDFVGGARGADELERAVDSGRAAVAFSLFPVRVEDLIKVSDAGAIMPPKSTWFEPKLRDGLLIHVI
jgi:uncharacterized protein (DUF1015 family)